MKSCSCYYTVIFSAVKNKKFHKKMFGISYFCSKHILRKTIEGYGFCFDFIAKGIIFSTQIINRYVCSRTITAQRFHKIFALPGSASRRLAETLEHP